MSRIARLNFSSVILLCITLLSGVGVENLVGRTPQTSGAGSREPNPGERDLFGVSGTSFTDVFAVGDAGTILHWDGRNWHPQPGGTFDRLLAVWMASPEDGYAVGAGGTIVRYHGSSWTLVPTRAGTAYDLRAVWGSSPKDVFAVGDAGTILHYDGDGWKSQVSNSVANLLAVWGLSPANVYAVGAANELLHYDGTSWQTVALNFAPPPGYGGLQYNFQAVWGALSEDLYLLGQATTFPDLTTLSLVLHFDGSSWSLDTPQLPFEAIWAASAADAYAIGVDGSILHFDGTRWSSQGALTKIGFLRPTTPLAYGIWATPDRHIFVVGPQGAIYDITF
jgi:photosystem II stability/assembly factor-like uncharacterized protein